MADASSPEVDVVRLTSELIQIDTSNRGSGDCQERPAAEYAAAQLAEVGIEPTILESEPGRANTEARIAGADASRPALLVHGHIDVVPAEAADWSGHPFSGEIRDGMVWGRGAMDMKSMVAMMLTVARQWAYEGRRPQRDIVLAFTADEEDSAAAGSDWLVRHHPDLFDGCTEGISESGGYTFHADSGVRLYPIGAGERGTAWLELTARGTAGHGSRVHPENAVGALAAAVARIDAYEWPVRLTATTRAALEQIGAALGVAVDPDAPDFEMEHVMDAFGTARWLVESTVRNSTNPTMLQAGYKVNVIPEQAMGRIDGRVIPGAEDEFVMVIDELTGEHVDWDYYHRDIGLQAPVDSPTFAAMRAALLAEDPDGHVVPMCMSGGTDAKQFSRLGIVGYGFAPLRLPAGFTDLNLVHGVDERVPVDGLEFGVRVLERFLSTA
jgi:acetylornithine deacetylase/succinyl-diaminopimelate desuccinylase-like protein